MGYEISWAESAQKDFNKIKKGNIQAAKRIFTFINEFLETANDPFSLPNCEKLQGYKEKRYRWRLGNYRIKAIKDDDENIKILYIIQISHRQGAYK